MVHERLPRHTRRSQLAAPRVAGGADFLSRTRVAWVGTNGQTHSAIPVQLRLFYLGRFGPFDVDFARAVASLTGHIGFLPSGVERIRCRVIPSFIGRGVAHDAHGVGGLVAPSPVQHVARWCFLRGPQVVPLLFDVVPRNLQGLQAPARHGNQVLLQRLHAKGVLDFKINQLAIGAIRVHKVLVPPLEEARGHTSVLELPPVKSSAHAGGCGQGHGIGMVRGTPVTRLLCMACQAGVIADVSNGFGA